LVYFCWPDCLSVASHPALYCRCEQVGCQQVTDRWRVDLTTFLAGTLKVITDYDSIFFLPLSLF
jgi:hypothetical protein